MSNRPIFFSFKQKISTFEAVSSLRLMKIGRSALFFGAFFVLAALVGSPANAATCPWSAGDYTLSANYVLPASATIYDCSAVSLVIPSGVTLTMQGNPVGGTHAALQLENLSVQAGGTISANGQGWVRTSGPSSAGTGGGTCAASYGGGSYGGVGGHGAFGGVGGPTYGSSTAPLDFGSTGCGLSADGAAGGIVRLDVSGIFSNSGTVTANGVQVNNSGGASGGSIFVTAGTAIGAGVMSARGANGWMNYEGGGGGGGRIAVVADTYGATYSYNVIGGTRASSAGGGNGTAGTIYYTDGPPEITDISLSPLAPFDTDDVTLSGTASDIDGLDHITVYLDSTDAGAMQNTCALAGANSGTCNLNAGMLAPGEHTIIVEAVALNAESVLDSEDFWVFDGLSPEISDLTAEPSVPNWTDDVNLFGGAGDADGIDYITVYLDSTDAGAMQNTCDIAGATSGDCTLNAGTLSAGQHQMIVRAADMSGATAEDAIFFTVVGDSDGGGEVSEQLCQEPSVTLTSPNGGEFLLAGATRLVQWQAQGCNLTGANLKLSTDSGATFEQAVATVSDAASGLYSWTVPFDVDSATVRLKIEVLGVGGILSSDVSDADFTIGEPTEIEPTAECETDEWVCGDWSSCLDGAQSRECELVLDCSTDNSSLVPSTSQSCVIARSCTADDWRCADWGACQPTGIQERSCLLDADCVDGDAVKPLEWQQCSYVEPIEEESLEPDLIEEESIDDSASEIVAEAEQQTTIVPVTVPTPSGQPSVPVIAPPPAPVEPNDENENGSLHERLMANQLLSVDEALQAMRDVGQAWFDDSVSMNEETMNRYIEVNVRANECEDLGLVVLDDCEAHLIATNGGTFPGCENLSEADCAQLKRVMLIGYLPADVLRQVDETVAAMAETGEVRAIPGITAINPDSSALSRVQLVQSIQSATATTSPFVMFIAPSAEQKLDNWTPPTQIGQPRGNGEVESSFSAKAVLAGEPGLAGLQFRGICDPDMVCYLFLYSYVPVVTAISTDENGDYVATLGDAVADGRHIAQVVTTDKQGNVVKKSEPEPFYVREGQAVDEGMYLGQGLYEGLTDEIIPAETFIQNLRQYALIVVVMFVFIIGLGWMSAVRRRQAQ
ncbi:MAG: hypothetical protein V1738_04390 [Patescibacteria group bacterium]